MIDESLEDQVWVTVVATGYDGAPRKRPLEQEPKGEPRVQRRAAQIQRDSGQDRDELRRRATAHVQSRYPEPRREPEYDREPRREREPDPPRRGNGLRVTEIDVPEFFMPPR